MTWPPTRPIRQRLFGAVFLAVWVGGMYLMWGWPTASERMARERIPALVGGGKVTEASGLRSLEVYLEVPVFRTHEFGLSNWLRIDEDLDRRLAIVPVRSTQVAPRGLTVALIMTAVSSLILYVGWRAAVSGLPGPRGVCDGCGYDLRALTTPRCPECGESPH